MSEGDRHTKGVSIFSVRCFFFLREYCESGNRGGAKFGFLRIEAAEKESGRDHKHEAIKEEVEHPIIFP